VILLLHCRSDVYKFAILKDEEIVLGCKDFQPSNGFIAKVVDDIDMGLEDGDVGPEF
jgi:hypothetical protein